MTFAQFFAQWMNPPGQRVDFDHEYGYQCVDLIRQYCYEVFGLGNSAGGVPYAIDFWTSTPAGILTKFQRLATTNVQAGDIVVLSDATPGNGGTSHIMIATGNQSATEFEGMEQNGGTGNGSGTGTDAIRTRYVLKSRIAGLLRPNVSEPPAPPSVPMITLDQLTTLYESILGRAPDPSGIATYVGHQTEAQVQNDLLNSPEYKQDQANKAAAMAAAAQATAQAAAQAAAAAVAAAKPAPTAPARPLTVPTSTIPYPIKTTLKVYGNLTDATNRTNSTGEIYAGAKWYVYCDKGMLNITQTPGASSGTWINPADNVVPAVITNVAKVSATVAQPVAKAPVETAATIRASFVPITPDGSPIECKVIESVLVVDALGLYPSFTQPAGSAVQVFGTFMASGQCNALVKMKDKTLQDRYMLGIPIASPDNFAPYLNDVYTLGDHLKISWAQWYDKIAKVISGASSVISSKNKN